METRVAWNTLQKEETRRTWMHPKTRAKLEAKSKKGNKNKKKSVEGMTGAQGEYSLDVLRGIFG